MSETSDIFRINDSELNTQCAVDFEGIENEKMPESETTSSCVWTTISAGITVNEFKNFMEGFLQGAKGKELTEEDVEMIQGKMDQVVESDYQPHTTPYVPPYNPNPFPGDYPQYDPNKFWYVTTSTNPVEYVDSALTSIKVTNNTKIS